MPIKLYLYLAPLAGLVATGGGGGGGSNVYTDDNNNVDAKGVPSEVGRNEAAICTAGQAHSLV